MNVLIIEDEPNIVEAISFIFKVVQAKDPVEPIT